MGPKSERDEWLMGQVALGKRDHLEPLVRRCPEPTGLQPWASCPMPIWRLDFARVLFSSFPIFSDSP